MRNRRTILISGIGAAAASAFSPSISFGQQGNIRVGLIAEMTGPFADFGHQFQTAIKAYVKRHGDAVNGRRIEVVVRDVGGPNPDLARRLAQELVLREKVSFLTGFGFSPNALSVANIATEAKVPMVVMNSQAVGLPSKSPYIVRVSTAATESAEAMGRWLDKSKVKKVMSLVIDYSPGHDAEKAFHAAFTQGGGQIVGALRVPLGSVEFGPFLQRVKDAKPDALFVFTNGGNPGVAFIRALRERGILEAGIQVVGTGDMTWEPVLDSVGEAALGLVTTYPYSPAHPSPENNLFVSDFLAAGDGKTLPTIFAASAYDGMAAIYEVVRRLPNVSGDKAMEVLKGLKLKSPRGPLEIDANTRDPKQVIYVRRTERRGDRVMNVEFDQVSMKK